jgi:siroheme synthase-like protein
MKLTGKDVLVVGAGRIGTGKAALLIDAGARVTIIARDVLAELPKGLFAIEKREYRDGDVRGFALVISAVGDAIINDRIVEATQQEGIWLNVVDDPLRSDFFFTAVHRSGDVVVSVSTEGASPALAQEIRSVIAEQLPENLADVARQLRFERATLHAEGTSTEGFDWRPRIRELLASTDLAR